MARPALLLALVIALAGCGGGDGDDPTLVTVGKGTDSAITSARTQVAYTQAELDALWADHRPGDPAPVVDFNRHMVIAVFHGFAGSPGYDVEVLSATTGNGNLNVVVEYSAPSPTCGGGGLVYYPFHVVRRARSDAPVAFVTTSRVSC